MKRFTETLKWQDPWFRKLTPEGKLLWLWLIDHADPAGVIEPDLGLASFQIGVDIDEHVITELEGHITHLDGGKILINSFIKFQYGTLSERCKPHNKVFEALARHGLDAKGRLTLSDTLPDRVSQRVLGTLEEEEEEEEEDNIKEEGCGEKPSGNDWAAAIVAAYPRRESTAACLTIVAADILGGANPETILAGTRAIAAEIAKAPSGALNTYVTSAPRFFREKLWQDDPATWRTRFAGKSSTGSTTLADVGGRQPGEVIKITKSA